MNDAFILRPSIRWNDEHAETKVCRSQHIHAAPLLTSKGLLNLNKHGPSIRSAPPLLFELLLRTAAVTGHANRSACCGVITSSARISQTLQQKANRSWRQRCVSLVSFPFLSARLHGEHESDDALFAALLHLAAFQCYSWERHHAVLTWTDFILL